MIKWKIKITVIIKEKYLSLEQFDYEISWIINDLSLAGIRKKKWVGELQKSALIIADLQNYFLLPESHAYIPSAQAVLGNIEKLIEFFRKNNRPVIFTKHINTKENAGSMSYWWNDLIDEKSAFSAIYGNLDRPGDIIFEKHQYDAFYTTHLEEFLVENKVKYPVICGLMTNLCCETTTRSAFVRGFQPVLPVDATATYNRQFHMATFRNLSFGFSPILTTKEILRIFEL